MSSFSSTHIYTLISRLKYKFIFDIQSLIWSKFNLHKNSKYSKPSQEFLPLSGSGRKKKCFLTFAFFSTIPAIFSCLFYTQILIAFDYVFIAKGKKCYQNISPFHHFTLLFWSHNMHTCRWPFYHLKKLWKIYLSKISLEKLETKQKRIFFDSEFYSKTIWACLRHCLHINSIEGIIDITGIEQWIKVSPIM